MNFWRTQELLERCNKFRVLIIGRANAGKTTILKRVCDTAEEPEVYNKHGEKVGSGDVDITHINRGQHDIENEMVFTSNPGFRFHDSGGFESGGIAELDRVREFITQRSHEQKMEDRLHAIWYCIPVDDSRPFTTAEEQFFSAFGTGHAPVIALFTKFDALDNKAFAALREERLSRADARSVAPNRATMDFERQHLNSFYDRPYPPKRHVYLRDMNKEYASCNELIRQTASTLDSGFLEKLLVSTQENTLELCTEYAFKRWNFREHS
ncbi:hypothetical protein M408DRAFT_313686 [Serendipita vermifera MAFF 305830]|uniref:G domain-containing protein n=1 Tax=Serendipita vermifera MAFF 305830 TaxID=933852 RepID=A0A0C2WIW0_SERVB|nr:hypothetical protein M408DRAFT_313686 [Serendipita vermifera MAFF 305830]